MNRDKVFGEIMAVLGVERNGEYHPDGQVVVRDSRCEPVLRAHSVLAGILDYAKRSEVESVSAQTDRGAVKAAFHYRDGCYAVGWWASGQELVDWLRAHLGKPLSVRAAGLAGDGAFTLVARWWLPVDRTLQGS